MKKLRSIVYTSNRKLVMIMMAIILLLTVFFQIIGTQRQATNNANATFSQVEQIIKESAEELATIKAEYRETCLLNAQVISYIIKHNPDILGDVEQFRQLADKLEIDEIHIFDETGRIFTGTHPEYFNFTFDSGEQMNFFKPMLTDKSLKLCQDITPNTAEGRLVQYSALWNSDKTYIIQIGMYPNAVLETTEKSELSYIFSLLKGNPGVSLYAIDAQTGVIVGSTSGTDNGKTYNEIGFKAINTELSPKPVHLSVNGIHSYCIFKNVDGTVIAYVVSSENLYNSIPAYTCLLALCLLVIAIVLIVAVQKFTDHYIINSISLINEKLRAVSEGVLDERVDVQTSFEFSELSNHINSMIHSLLASMDKMSFVLKFTNMPIGVYEYNLSAKKTHFTEHVPKILSLDEAAAAELSSDSREFREFIKKIKQNAVPDMKNTYYIDNKKYIKLEELVKETDTLGIVIDVTEEVINLKQAEAERDVDLLTGLYNRRGMERLLDKLFYAKRNEVGCGALIVIDIDDMKTVNDTYGHSVGDTYLKGYGEVLRQFNAPNTIAARVGGDEFVLFVYGYENDEAVGEAFAQLRKMQDNATLALGDGKETLMRFSFGYRLLNEAKDYTVLLSSADEFMYHSKRLRKKLAAENESNE